MSNTQTPPFNFAPLLNEIQFLNKNLLLIIIKVKFILEGLSSPGKQTNSHENCYCY